MRLFGWVFGILFLVAGLGMLGKSLFVLGLSYFVMGAVIFPPVRRWLQRTGWPLSIQATLWILMFCVIGITVTLLSAGDPTKLMK